MADKETAETGKLMKKSLLVKSTVAACLVLGALLPFAGPVSAVEMQTPADRTLYADVTGTVVDDETGLPLKGVPVSLLYETVVTDQNGTFVFQKIPMIHTAEVSLRVSTEEGLIIGCTTFDIPVRYYPIGAVSEDKVDVKVVDPGIDGPVELRLKRVAVSQVETYCTSCHQKNPCIEKSSFTNVVSSGKDLRGIIVKESQLEKYIENLKQKGISRDFYTKLRYQDTHPDKIDLTQILASTGRHMGLYQKPEGLALDIYTEKVNGKDVLRQIVVCDTCHSRHQPTTQRQYVILPFDENSQLCYRCHK